MRTDVTIMMTRTIVIITATHTGTMTYRVGTAEIYYIEKYANSYTFHLLIAM